MPRCNVKGCGRPAARRGVCSGCYQACRRLINDGQITDEELVEQKLLLPRRPTRQSVVVRRVKELDR